MQWSYLGRVAYDDALQLQQCLRRAVAEERTPGTLVLLEHPPVITLGRSARPENLLVSEEELQRQGVGLARVERGGDVTYHGPGQLVGYPIRRVDRAVEAHVRGMADALVRVLAGLGIRAWWETAHPGVWTEQGKIGAVGVDARGGVAIHGFALNVCPDLDHFSLIIPCGLRAPVTSVEELLGRATPALEELARSLAVELGHQYGCRMEEISPDAIDAVAERH